MTPYLYFFAVLYFGHILVGWADNLVCFDPFIISGNKDKVQHKRPFHQEDLKELRNSRSHQAAHRHLSCLDPTCSDTITLQSKGRNAVALTMKRNNSDHHTHHIQHSSNGTEGIWVRWKMEIYKIPHNTHNAENTPPSFRVLEDHTTTTRQ